MADPHGKGLHMTRCQQRAVKAKRDRAKTVALAKRLEVARNEANRETVKVNLAAKPERNYYPQSQWATMPGANGIAKRPSLKRQITVMFSATERKSTKGKGCNY